MWSLFLLSLASVLWLPFREMKGLQQVPAATAPAQVRQEWVDRTLQIQRLSLEEKVGQMLQVRCFEDYPGFDSPEYRYLREQLQTYSIGSVILAAHISRTGLVRASPVEVATLTNQLQRDSKLPLLIASDIERGVASRLKDVPDFPWPMAFGAADNIADIERFAAITAREARAVGIHWALAPVADVNSNPANPIINARSFGEDPQRVGNLVTAFIRGAHENGMLVTAKHFPGNGDASVDSHRTIALIPASLEHLQRVEFPPFKAAIVSGVDAILLAHARVPALEPDPEIITTVSRRVVEGVLKDQLAFKGIVLTDALEMRGLTQLYATQGGNPRVQAAVDAIKAGCDVIMVPTDLDGAFHAIIHAVRSGEISESRIDESVRKILRMKAWVGLNKSRFVEVGKAGALATRPEDTAFAQQVADRAVTLVRHRGGMLPLDRPIRRLTDVRPYVGASVGGVAVRDASSQAGAIRPSAVGSPGPASGTVTAIVLGEVLESTNGRGFEKALRARCPKTQVLYFDGRTFQTSTAEILDAVHNAGRVVVAAYVAHRGARQATINGRQVTSFGLAGPSGGVLQDILSVAREKTVVVTFGSPYLIVSFPEIQTYICTYAMASTSEISAVKALFGEIQNHAKLPVTLPRIASRGFSLPWPSKRIARP